MRPRRLLWAPVLLALAVPWSAQADRVSVVQDDDIYTVRGAFNARAETSTAWLVLTDYEHIRDYAHALTTDSVERRTDGTIIVYQTLTTGLPPFRRKARIAVNVVEDRGANRVAFRDTLGTDFRGYEGEWRIEPTAEGSRVTYFLRARLRWSLPGPLVRFVLGRKTNGILERLRSEIESTPKDAAADSTRQDTE